MNSTEARRKMPSSRLIREMWAKYLVDTGKAKSEHDVLTRDFCWACGHEGDTERAHILARCEGGSDLAENLHLLCFICHRHSELLSGGMYFLWFGATSEAGRLDVRALRMAREEWTTPEYPPERIKSPKHGYALAMIRASNKDAEAV